MALVVLIAVNHAQTALLIILVQVVPMGINLMEVVVINARVIVTAVLLTMFVQAAQVDIF